MTKIHSYIPLLLATALVLVAAGTFSIVNSQSANGKYDRDGDGLIEVEFLEQLDAIRYDPDGDGDSSFTEYYDAFPISLGESICRIPCHGYELFRSLDFNDPGSYSSSRVRVEWTNGNGWQSIGHDPKLRSGFNSIFEGNNYTITNLYIDHHDREEISGARSGFSGLFSTTGSSSIIRRLGMVSVDITSASGSGGLVGQNAGTIIDCFASGSVIVIGWASSDDTAVVTSSAGGLAGLSDGLVRNSYSTTRVMGDGRVGGLVGRNWGSVISSYATGQVSDRDSDNEYGEFGRSVVGNIIGGLVGSNRGMVNTSYAIGDVSGDNQVGGLVGQSFYDGIISDSFATGEVRGHSSVGGLVGDNYGRINNSYSIGRVFSDSRSGGLVGRSVGSESAQVQSSFWDTESSKMGAVRRRTQYGDGKTTAELQTPTSNSGIYSEWNPEFWDFGTTRQYPVLKIDLDGDGVAAWWELGPQTGQRATPTPTPRPTSTPTPTLTPTPLPTNTPTPTPTLLPTNSPTPTPTPLPTNTPTLTPTPTNSPTPLPTNTPTPTTMPTETPTPTLAPRNTPTLEPTATTVPTHTPTSIPTDTPALPTDTPAPTTTSEPTGVPTAVPEATPAPAAESGGGACGLPAVGVPPGATAINLFLLAAPLGMIWALKWRKRHRRED